MKPSDVNERIERIEYRIEKEYVFDEEDYITTSMEADLVWTLKVIAQLKEEREALSKASGHLLDAIDTLFKEQTP